MDEADHAIGEARLQPIEPDYRRMMRLLALLGGAVLLVPVLILDFVLMPTLEMPSGTLTVLAVALVLAWVLRMPSRRYHSWGYRLGGDELHVAHGVVTRVYTVVPLHRVQHIDVAQGPVERRFALTRLVLHTAGTRSSAVTIPGLRQPDAEAMRDAIRVHIRQDLL